MAMRVYEFSKKHGLNNKEVLEFLHKHGIDVASHMSVLPDQAVAVLEKHYVVQQPAPKKETAAPSKVAVLERKQMEPQPIKRSVVAEEKKDMRMPSSVKEAPIKETKKTEEPRMISLIAQPMTVGEISDRLHKPISEIILLLLRQGVAATKNQMLNEKIIEQIARHYSISLEEPKAQTKVESQVTQLVVPDGERVERLPVVVVVGHVDHGKTTLLDFIRKTRVAAREKGGITQHLGAYLAQTEHGALVFLDTPGHEAFTMMRGRGIRVADIAILVVAADDGIMPQTLEAIRQAKAVGLPIVVAINKIDKATPSQIEGVKRGLTQHDLAPEEWGGQTICVPISAKLGQGINELLEVIILQSKLMELAAPINVPARGIVLESRLEKGLGPVATVICQHGTLRVGDHFVCGNIAGKVNSLIDTQGKRLQEVLPSIPVMVAGFPELPHAGDVFEIVPASDIKKYKADMMQDGVKQAVVRQIMSENTLNLIIKTDVVSSKEALLNAIAKMTGKAFKEIYIVAAGVGTITESDIILAADTKAMIYGLHTKVEANAAALVQKLGVTVKLFDIIYKLLEDLQIVSEQGKPAKKVLKKIGEAVILKVFDIKNVGIIAGAQVKSGRFTRDGKVAVWRGKHKVGEGLITSLQRDRKSVKEVHGGFEFAFMVDKFTEWESDDRVECYLEVLEV